MDGGGLLRALQIRPRRPTRFFRSHRRVKRGLRLVRNNVHLLQLGQLELSDPLPLVAGVFSAFVGVLGLNRARVLPPIPTEHAFDGSRGPDFRLDAELLTLPCLFLRWGLLIFAPSGTHWLI